MWFLCNLLMFALCIQMVGGHTTDTFVKISKDISIIEDMKKLNANTDEKVWREYVERLATNHLTVADCIRFMAEQREQKALAEVVREWGITDPQVRIIKDALERTKKGDAKNSFVLEIEKGVVIAPELIQLIEKKAHDWHITVPIRISVDSAMKDTAAVTRRVNNKLEVQPVVLLKLNAFHADPRNKQLELFDSALEHEFCHVIYRHSELVMMLLWIINSKDWYSPLASRSFQKLLRAHEATADRVSQACCKEFATVRRMYNHIKMGVMHALAQNIDIDDQTQLPTHPSLRSRCKWAQRIYNLKLLEQEYVKQKKDIQSHAQK